MTTNSPLGQSDMHHEQYGDYAAFYDPDYAEAWTPAPAKPRKRKQKKDQQEEVAALTDAAEGLEAGFEISYKPARHEAIWLLSSLQAFYDQALIVDVQAQVKGGKEASVYRCAAHPTLDMAHVAAKVYRPRKFRNLRNDKMYREGRRVLDINGRPVKEDDVRAMRALEKGTAFGAQLAHTSWLMHEFNTLDRLYRAGGSVPKPIASAENALLMTYVGDAQMAAPILHSVTLAPDAARRLFAKVVDNIELMLTHNLIHGDLSAYNILYWEGDVTLIDFPQVVNSRDNTHARRILARDVTRICDYFASQGVDCDARTLTTDLWNSYAYRDPLDEIADFSRWGEDEEEEEE